MEDRSAWNHLKAAIGRAGEKAARLYWADLHVHSPESRNFATTPSELRPDDHNGRAHWFLSEVSQAGPKVRVLGITDHFKCRTACEAASLGSQFDLLVLPGIEVAVRCNEFHNDKIHLLFLFPPSSGTETIYSLVLALNGPQYGESGESSYIDKRVSDVLQHAADKGAICVAAHVNTSAGMRHFIRRTSLELLPAKRREQELRAKAQRTSDEDGELARLAEELATVEDEVQKR